MARSKSRNMPHNTLAPWAELAPGVAPMTIDELLALPEDAFWRYELVEGRLARMAPPGGEHGVIAGNLHIALGSWVLARGLGRVLAAETGFQIGSTTVLAADVAFVRAERVPAPGSAERKRFWRFAPDIVAEVASPSQSRGDQEAKARAWLDAGALLVWVIWPNSQRVDVWRTVEVDSARQPQRVATLGIGDALDGLDVLSGFSYPLADLFA